MTACFADTFFFLRCSTAVTGPMPGPSRSQRSRPSRLITTAWVLIEVADAMAAPANRANVVAFLGSLRANAHVEIVPADAESFDRGLEVYAHRLDKGWSLTDCISFVVMTDRGLRDALTADHHFEQAGYRALMKGD